MRSQEAGTAQGLIMWKGGRRTGMCATSAQGPAYTTAGEYFTHNLCDHANVYRPARANCRAAVNGWSNPRYFKTHSFRDSLLSMILLKRVSEGEPEPLHTNQSCHQLNNQQQHPLDNQQQHPWPQVPIPWHIDRARRTISSPSSSSVSSLNLSVPAAPASPARASTAVLAYTRSLSRITGVITDPHVLAFVQAQSVPAGVSRTVDTYLDAHGYDAEAKLAICHAWDTYDDLDDFIQYLSLKGMASSEASWIFLSALLV